VILRLFGFLTRKNFARCGRFGFAKTVTMATLFVASSILFFTVTSTAWALDNNDLPPSHSVTSQMYATGFEFAEGPTFDRDGNLYVVNYRGNGNIGKITPDGKASIFCVLSKIAPVDDNRQPKANGLKIDSERRLVVADAGTGRLLRISPDGSEAEVLADRWNGTALRSVNDVALDQSGNIYFTDPGGSSVDKPTGSVYRYNIETKKVSRLVTGLAFPNGLAITPDQKHLCIAESQKFRILIYDLLPKEKVGPQRVLCTFPEKTVGKIKGGKFEPDGLIFDAKGRLYVAMFNGGVINVVDLKTGKLLRQYDAGGDQATNCHFHGPYLYITIAAKEAVFRLKLNVSGFAYNGVE